MAVTVYKSTDGSAPVLTGEVDKLCLLLRAILVDGYGAKAAAGWTETYDGANKKVFRQGGGNQLYLRVQDDGPGAGGAKEARITGYETMSDVDTGTGPMPTAAQGVGGIAMVVARKSATADTTARAWICVADNRTLYFFAATGDTANAYIGFAYGEFYSFLAADGYRVHIIGRDTENSGATAAESMDDTSRCSRRAACRTR